MTEVTAKQSFDHNGSRRRGDKFTVSQAHATALEKAGLVSIQAEKVDEAPGSKAKEEPASDKPATRRKAKNEAE